MVYKTWKNIERELSNTKCPCLACLKNSTIPPICNKTNKLPNRKKQQKKMRNANGEIECGQRMEKVSVIIIDVMDHSL